MSESGEMGTSETKINWKQGMVSHYQSSMYQVVDFVMISLKYLAA